MRWFWMSTLALLGLLLCPSVSEARVEADSGYSKQLTFSTALRYLRVDLGYDVKERDVEAGYLLFEFPSGSNDRVVAGSIEVVEVKGRVRIFVQIPKLPHYREQLLSKGLQKKLRHDYGDPPKRKRPKKKKKKPADGDKQPNDGAGAKNKQKSPVDGASED